MLLKEYPSITWIDINHVERGQRIGLGASAEVRRGTYNGTPVAVKVPFFSSFYFFLLDYNMNKMKNNYNNYNKWNNIIKYI